MGLISCNTVSWVGLVVGDDVGLCVGEDDVVALGELVCVSLLVEVAL